jgi:hypothetical protein
MDVQIGPAVRYGAERAGLEFDAHGPVICCDSEQGPTRYDIRRSEMKNNLPARLSVGLALTLVAAAPQAKDIRTEFECRAHSADGMQSMSTDYEERRGDRLRERFIARFESAPGFGLRPGDILNVNVNGQLVGAMRLHWLENGDIGAELDFDSNVDRDQPDTTVPFPANWPGVSRGSTVMVGVLGCSLQSR